MRVAHRLSYTLNVGPIPDGQCVLHRCDNPPCVNPTHLFLGTRADNNADREAKGRGVPSPGERNGRAKLNPEKLAMIHRMRAEGATQQAIADVVGVSQVQVGKVLRGKAWGEVT